MRHVLLLTLAEYFHGLKSNSLPAVLLGGSTQSLVQPDFHVLLVAATIVLFDLGLALFPAAFAFCGHMGDWLTSLDPLGAP